MISDKCITNGSGHKTEDIKSIKALKSTYQISDSSPFLDFKDMIVRNLFPH